MRKFFAVAMGSLVALAGFAGMASASATVDLIWIDVSNTNTNGAVICLAPNNRNCPPDPRSPDSGVTISSVAATDSLTLGVILTAGPNGTIGGGVSVDYNDAIPKLSVTGFQSLVTTKPQFFLPGSIGTTSDTMGFIDNINAACCGPLAGIGLPAGGTAYLGTVTFHKDQLQNGTFEIAVGVNGPGNTDGLLSLDPIGADISATSTYNSAFLVNVPEPGALSLLVMGLGGMLLAGRGRS